MRDARDGDGGYCEERCAAAAADYDDDDCRLGARRRSARIDTRAVCECR